MIINSMFFNCTDSNRKNDNLAIIKAHLLGDNLQTKFKIKFKQNNKIKSWPAFFF